MEAAYVESYVTSTPKSCKRLSEMTSKLRGHVSCVLERGVHSPSRFTEGLLHPGGNQIDSTVYQYIPSAFIFILPTLASRNLFKRTSHLHFILPQSKSFRYISVINHRIVQQYATRRDFSKPCKQGQWKSRTRSYHCSTGTAECRNLKFKSVKSSNTGRRC